MATIRCIDCEQTVQARNKTTKRCRLCRFVRDLAFHATKPEKVCPVTGTKFLGTRAGDELHASATVQWRKERRDTEPCAYCKLGRAWVIPEARVCLFCAQSKDLRPQMIKHLSNKQDKIAAAPKE